MRRIVHIDMDAFYASVEQRDDARLRDRPVVVAWRGPRSVVCAASYEARRFGVRSAMPAVRAERLCPDAEFVAPDFTRYRAVSRQVREIFRRYTPLVEPLSLDEAYLDVSVERAGLGSATEVAEQVRTAIRTELRLTASAGVAPCKYLAKIASDWRKPDGQFVIRPGQERAFLETLPVRKLPGVGRRMEQALNALGIGVVGELARRRESELIERFGRFGRRLHQLARGIDESAVVPNRPTQSISAEDTFADDRPLSQIEGELMRLCDKVWRSYAREPRRARTVVLKLKTADFRILTRSRTPGGAITSERQFKHTIRELIARVDAGGTRFRLVGAGLGNFCDPDDPRIQSGLFG